MIEMKTLHFCGNIGHFSVYMNFTCKREYNFYKPAEYIFLSFTQDLQASHSCILRLYVAEDLRA